MKKKLMILFIWGATLGTGLYADQAAWISRRNANLAVKCVNEGSRIRLFCQPCGDKTWREITVLSSESRKELGSYYQVYVNGRGIDLAYTYVRSKGVWRNLARILRIKVSGVDTVLGKADRVATKTIVAHKKPAKLPPRKPKAQSQRGRLATAEVGRRVLAAARRISFIEKKIIRGSCWDFVNAVFTRAGFPGRKRHYYYRSKKRGPYVLPARIKPGDWLYLVNLEYHGIEHSAIFVRWISYRRRLAETIDYAGMKRREPGKIRRHRLTKVYTIIRGGRKPKRR